MSHTPRTIINGINVGGQTADEAQHTIQSNIETRELLIQGENGLSDTVTSAQIDLAFDNKFGDLEKLLDKQDPYFWQMHLLKRDDIEMHTHYYYNGATRF